MSVFHRSLRTATSCSSRPLLPSIICGSLPYAIVPTEIGFFSKPIHLKTPSCNTPTRGSPTKAHCSTHPRKPIEVSFGIIWALFRHCLGFIWTSPAIRHELTTNYSLIGWQAVSPPASSHGSYPLYQHRLVRGVLHRGTTPFPL